MRKLVKSVITAVLFSTVLFVTIVNADTYTTGLTSVADADFYAILDEMDHLTDSRDLDRLLDEVRELMPEILWNGSLTPLAMGIFTVGLPEAVILEKVNSSFPMYGIHTDWPLDGLNGSVAVLTTGLRDEDITRDIIDIAIEMNCSDWSNVRIQTIPSIGVPVTLVTGEEHNGRYKYNCCMAEIYADGYDLNVLLRAEENSGYEKQDVENCMWNLLSTLYVEVSE